jgi:DNA-binding CsgD family transcriptional regulator
MAAMACTVFWLLLPLLVIGAVINWAVETRSERIRRLAAAGRSQRVIAEQLGCTRHQVRRVLAAA